MNFLKRIAGILKPQPPLYLVVDGSQSDRWLIPSGTRIDIPALVNFLLQAEQGETRPWFAFCDEMRARDSFLDAELEKSEEDVSGARVDVLVVPASMRSRGKGPRAGKAAVASEVASYVQEVLLAPSVRIGDAFADLMDGYWKGLASLQVVVEAKGRDERIVSLAPPPGGAQRFCWRPDSPELMVQVGADWNTLRPVSELGRSLVTFVPEARVPSPARRGVYRRLVPYWTIRTKGPGWWARDVEKYGIPPLIGKHPENDTTTKAALAAAFRKWGADGQMIVPTGAEIEQMQAVARGAGDSPHEAILEWTARQISIRVRGATTATDVQRGSGSRALTETHKEVATEKSSARAARAAACLREQLVFGLVAHRFGMAVALEHTPELAVRVGRPPDFAAWADGMSKAVGAGFGSSIPRSLINEMGYAPEPEEGEPTLEQPAPVSGQLPGAPVESPEGDDGQEQEEPPQGASRRRVRASSPGKEISALDEWASRLARGAGEELVAEVRTVIDQAERDGATLPQLLSRVIQVSPVPPEAPEFVDLLAAVQLEGTMRGLAGAKAGTGR